MDDFELEPRYSTREIPGKCIKCLAEQEYSICLRELLKGGYENNSLIERYQSLVSLLTSNELEKLRDESERYLAEGKDVKIILHLGGDKPGYEVRLDEAA